MIDPMMQSEAERFFTHVLPGDDALWTGGYLNERFPRPVSRPDDIFFATFEEIAGLIGSRAKQPHPLSPLPRLRGGERGWGQSTAVESHTLAARREVFDRLQQEFDRAPAQSYPAFLRGNRPLDAIAPAAFEGGQDYKGVEKSSGLPTRPLPRLAGEGRGGGEKIDPALKFSSACPPLNETTAARWQGTPVSPGMARGTVRVVLAPTHLDRIAPGDILVAPSTDPGWTPVFGRLAGLIVARGGQLSHGAVAARKYGLPAVVVPGITERLHDGDVVTLDGMTGVIVLEKRG